MSWYRWLLCTLCLVVVDSAWLFLLLAVLGFLAGIGHAPLSFAVAQGVLVLAVCAAAAGAIVPVRWRRIRWLSPLAGAVVVWLAVAVAAPGVGVDVGPGWPLALVAGQLTPSVAMVLALVGLPCAWLWRHGIRRGRGAAGAPTIARSFRAGLIVLVTVLALESAGGLDLGTRGVLLPFFAAALMGMAIARAPVHGGASGSWVLMAGGTVAVVLVAGLVLASALVVAVRGGLGVLWVMWVDLATAASESVSATLASLLGTDSSSGLGITPTAMEPSQGFVLLVLLAGAVVMGGLAHRVLGTPRKELPRIVLDLGEEEREVIDAADSRVLERLVDAVMPSWWRRRAPAPGQGAPKPGITEVVMLYRRLLELAHRRGVDLNPAHTPFERAPALGRALPGAPVDALTGRFVAACYGGEPTPPEVVQRLARDLDTVAHDRGR